jgi:hypothetical protein
MLILEILLDIKTVHFLAKNDAIPGFLLAKTHFPFSDLNNVEVADLLSGFRVAALCFVRASDAGNDEIQSSDDV